ncbi:MAG TPA: hypothetical protein VMH40_16985 [Myxococcaceae bacterium]|nr:hypothetical protein [Myxococcaceae bacterium]
MGAWRVEVEGAESLGVRDFFGMERAEIRIEGGRPIRTFWNEQGRRFELDARARRWREVPGIGPRPGPFEGWHPLLP